MLLRALVLAAAVVLIPVVFAPACAAKKTALEGFVDNQKERMTEKSAYVQADFDFWAAMYEPTEDDLERLRSSWIEHGQAFPESKAISEIEREVKNHGQSVVIVALFMTYYENADLRDKTLGWATYPVTTKITELPNSDVVLRTLMPVRNQWARYFMLRFPPGLWRQSSTLVVSNRTSRVDLKRWRFTP
jgi:hypothetical protein